MDSASEHTHSTSGTLAPLGPVLNVGLIPVALFGILSFGAATGLLALLTWRIFQWNRKSRHVNQFVFLIYNLLLADIQQSMAFLLNARWLANDAIVVGTSTCWAQGCKSPFSLTFRSCSFHNVALCEDSLHTTLVEQQG